MPLDLSPIWISLETSLTATAITLFLGVAAASWRANRRGIGPALLDSIFLLPLVLPPTVVGFLLLLIFGRNGPLGRLLLHFGATVVFSWSATVIAAAVVSFPLMYLSVRASVEQVDAHLLQAARALGEFGATLMLAGSIPGRTQTIPIAIYFAVESNDLHQAAAWSLIDISISLTMIAGMYYWAHLRSPERTQWARRGHGSRNPIRKEARQLQSFRRVFVR